MKAMCRILVGSFALFPPLTFGEPSAAAPATTAPADVVVELQTEDPAKPESKSYVDLDTGKLYEYGASTPEDLNASRRWLHDSGVDLMCESRAPADGFVAYDMALIESELKLDEVTDFAAIAKQLEPITPKAFNPVSVGLVFPRTYLFRTREGEVGGLEVKEISEQPPGLRLRFKVVHQPPTTQPQHLTPEQIRIAAMTRAIGQREAAIKDLEAREPQDDKLRQQIGLMKAQLDAIKQMKASFEAGKAGVVFGSSRVVRYGMINSGPIVPRTPSTQPSTQRLRFIPGTQPTSAPLAAPTTEPSYVQPEKLKF